mgnify:CR=1 FL=1
MSKPVSSKRSLSAGMKTLKERPPLETSVEQYLVDQVRALGGKTIKLAGAEAGTPDRLVMLPGSPAFLIELKRPGKMPSPLQLRRLAEWREVGMLSFWANTRDMVDVVLSSVLDRAEEA